jgi:hypothetical protein
MASATTAVAAIPARTRIGTRLQASRSNRRIIWNNDGDDLRFVAFKGTRSNGIERLWTARNPDDVPLPEKFSSLKEVLDLRMTALRDTPVDTISFCGIFNWPAWEMPRERIAALGDDPIRPIVEFTHRLGKEYFFNIRMNDCHSSLRFHGAAWWEPFRLRNLHLLQSKISPDELEKRYLPWIRGESDAYPVQAVQDRRGAGNRDVQSWSAYDYAHPEVREYFLGLIETVCERYDIDGVDLDWLRHPFFFRFGGEREGIPMMNDFVRRVAAIVRAAGTRRGRPIVIAMRVPDSPDRAVEIGLDVSMWISEGWIDLLVAGNGLTGFSQPLRPWIELAAPRGLPVYGCITRNAPGLADPAALRGVSQRLWESGISGLYYFNHFMPPEYGSIADAADRARLASLTKTYLVDSSYTRLQNGTVFSGPLPLDFSTCVGETTIELPIEIPEAVTGAKSLTISVRWRGDGMEACSRWSVNEREARLINRGKKGELVYNGTNIVPGVNRLRITVKPTSSESNASLVLLAVRVTVERS